MLYVFVTLSVLNWNTYERFNKSETIHRTIDGVLSLSPPPLWMVATLSPLPAVCRKVLPDSAFTTALFRFLQLLCEGHNEGEVGGGAWE